MKKVLVLTCIMVFTLALAAFAAPAGTAVRREAARVFRKWSGGRPMTSGVRLNRTLACLIGVQICLNGCMAGVRMAAPLLCLRLGYGTAAVGVLLALFAFVQLFLAIPAGRYADRHNLKRPVTICMGLAVLGAGLAAIWPVFPALCAAVSPVAAWICMLKIAACCASPGGPAATAACSPSPMPKANRWSQTCCGKCSLA